MSAIWLTLTAVMMLCNQAGTYPVQNDGLDVLGTMDTYNDQLVSDDQRGVYDIASREFLNGDSYLTPRAPLTQLIALKHFPKSKRGRLISINSALTSTVDEIYRQQLAQGQLRRLISAQQRLRHLG